VVVRDNAEYPRYELLLDGDLVGEILYRRFPDRIALIHTEVSPSAEGQGLGARLVAGAGARRHPCARPARRADLSVRQLVHQSPSGLRRPRRAEGERLRVTSAPELERGPTRTYEGDAIEVHWEPRLCIHMRNCVRGLPNVFRPEARPWIAVDAADADAIAAAVESCPTGALRYRRLDGGPQEEPPAETTIEPRPNGPLFVRGRVRIVGPEGEVIREDARLALCRCGASENKPFCDGSHRRIGFTTP
jgi:uncharacterized Fe-S cluster protein YjdI